MFLNGPLWVSGRAFLFSALGFVCSPLPASADGSYRALEYPGGDLQKNLHEDLRAHWDPYSHPRGWHLARPDANFDHRRVPNLMTWFERAGHAVPMSRAAADYLPGDIVSWDPGGRILHIGIVSDRRSAAGVPLVLHNIGAGAREEDILFRYAIIGHYRL